MSGGTVYEPEGLAFFRNGATGGILLCTGIISGDPAPGRFVRIYALGINAKSKFPGGIEVSEATAGDVLPISYTPTLTAVTNVAASTPFTCQGFRVGNVVNFSGRVDIDPTAAGAVELGMSLPIASDFTVTFQAAGTFSGNSITQQDHGVILADAINNRLSFRFIATNVGNIGYYFNVTYRIL